MGIHGLFCCGKMEVDFLLIGQGIAGSSLAYYLIQKGNRVLVVDREDLDSSSRVAAGLITPLTGRGINPAWRQAEYLPKAVRHYRHLENESGESFYHDQAVRRILLSSKEQVKWQKKAQNQADWGEECDTSDDIVNSSFGAIKMKHGAWLDTKSYLRVIRGFLLSKSAYRVDDFSEDELQLNESGVLWRGIKAKKVIFCQGAYGLSGGNSVSSWFANIPHRSAKGEILSLRIKGFPSNIRYHANGWLAPRDGGVWKAGATYEWSQLDTKQTDAGELEVLQKIKSILPDDSKVEVVGHEAGIRPIIRSSRPVIGLHHEFAQIGFFNGLGSKGALMAPATAEHFASYLSGECELDSELTWSSELNVIGEKEKVMKKITVTGSLLHKAHKAIKLVVEAGDCVIDSTLGNGHDALFLSKLIGNEGKLIGFDIQKDAIEKTEENLITAGIEKDNFQLYQLSHAEILNTLASDKHEGEKVSAIMFNLGYLPSGDKAIITKIDSTLSALQQSTECLKVGGVITVMCYPGHSGGDDEAKAVVDWANRLDEADTGGFQVSCYCREGARETTPFLLVVNKHS